MSNIFKKALNIIEGHTNELLGVNLELSEKRLDICKNCGLYTETELGPICDNHKWINPKTQEVKNKPDKGFINGCACRLNAKTTLKDEKCIINKW